MRNPHLLLAVLISTLPLSLHGQRMQKAEEPEEVGLTSIGEAPFPVPEGVAVADLPNADFEEAWSNGDSLKFSRFERVESDEAPEGKAFLQRAKGGTGILDLTQPVRGNTPYLLSGWMKTDSATDGRASSDTNAIYYGKHTPLQIPNTSGEWKRVGLYFRTAVGASAVQISFRFLGESLVAFDDLQFREASEKEFAKAYQGWRSQYPERDHSARPGDGKNLALFVSKLTEPQFPELPLTVVGIGSSYTNMLGNGERLVQWVRENYPDAPEIRYQKHVGSAVEFDFTRGWMRQHVLSKRPDLVILYSGGNAEDLDKLLADFRAHSSADVIVASLHLRERDVEITDETINAPEWDEVRDVALQYGCEWVDSRREWGAYLRKHEQPIEWLLKDAVHQSDHGALVINENICRHLVPNPDPAYQPEDRERWVSSTELVENGGEGVVSNDGKTLKLRFRGNRLDLIGKKSASGGILGADAPIRIDGAPLDELPVFLTTLIRPGADNFRPERGSTSDRSPHAVFLGESGTIVPQTWTIRMYGDAGAYELLGSVTGHDGFGHNGGDFTGNSGQITVPSDLWRRRLEADGETYSNRDGDTFTWQVKRATTPQVDFGGNSERVFLVTLADQLANGWHELELPIEGFSDSILSFRVCEPPLGREVD